MDQMWTNKYKITKNVTNILIIVRKIYDNIFNGKYAVFLCRWHINCSSKVKQLLFKELVTTGQAMV